MYVSIIQCMCSFYTNCVQNIITNSLYISHGLVYVNINLKKNIECSLLRRIRLESSHSEHGLKIQTQIHQTHTQTPHLQRTNCKKVSGLWTGFLRIRWSRVRSPWLRLTKLGVCDNRGYTSGSAKHKASRIEYYSARCQVLVYGQQVNWQRCVWVCVCTQATYI